VPRSLLLLAAHHRLLVQLLVPSRPPTRSPSDTDVHRARGERGQATTEYALILLAAAVVALAVVAWATAGGGAARIGALFDRVIDGVIDRV
jgi:Flp pilus assembly pilin Flp